MAITVAPELKVATKPKTQVVAAASLDEQIDNLGRLQIKIETAHAKYVQPIEEQLAAANDKHLKANKELADLMAAQVIEVMAEGLPEGEKAKHSTKLFSAALGALTQTRTIDGPKALRLIHKKLGDEAFYKLASVPLKALDDYLTPEEREKVLSLGWGGKRKLKVEPLDQKLIKKAGK